MGTERLAQRVGVLIADQPEGDLGNAASARHHGLEVPAGIAAPHPLISQVGRDQMHLERNAPLLACRMQADRAEKRLAVEAERSPTGGAIRPAISGTPS
jgi:hypothetical protein